jgi:hypothetical protein
MSAGPPKAHRECGSIEALQEPATLILPSPGFHVRENVAPLKQFGPLRGTDHEPEGEVRT